MEIQASAIYLAGSVRTAIGKFGGSLADRSAAEQGAASVMESLRRSGMPADRIEELIFGNARQAGGGPNVARQIAHRAGAPITAPAFTVNQACASGLKSITLAYQEIALGRRRVVATGGVESMSRVPYFVERARWGARLGHTRLVDAMVQDGFLCPLSGMVMGETAELLADRYSITRAEQDIFAQRSHERAARAMREGRFQSEIVPVVITDGKGNQRLFDSDEHVRHEISLDTLARLPPVFKPDGTITPGNASGITDGAASMMVLSGGAAVEAGVTPEARILDYETVGVEPELMGLAPVTATQRLLHRTALTLAEIDLIELNEAFAAQVLACDRELGMDHGRLNVSGGAIALGHPIGCSGARIVVTLIHELMRRKARLGLATLCVSGGLGVALLLENVAA